MTSRKNRAFGIFHLMWCLLVAMPGIAQEVPNELVTGTVHTINGDTLEGLLQLGSPVSNQRMLWYYNDNGDRKFYSIREIKSYSFLGPSGKETYTRKASKHFLTGDSLLLHLLQSGALTVYEYYFEYRGNLKSSGGLAMLLVEKDKQPLLRIRKAKFRKQLKKLLADHPSIPGELENGTHEWADVLKVISAYNVWADTAKTQ